MAHNQAKVQAGFVRSWMPLDLVLEQYPIEVFWTIVQDKPDPEYELTNECRGTVSSRFQTVQQY